MQPPLANSEVRPKRRPQFSDEDIAIQKVRKSIAGLKIRTLTDGTGGNNGDDEREDVSMGQGTSADMIV